MEWSELRKNPPRYVRLSLIGMAMRGPSRDARDDWMGIELIANFANAYHVDSGPILDEVAAMSRFMAGQISQRRHLFEQ